MEMPAAPPAVPVSSAPPAWPETVEHGTDGGRELMACPFCSEPILATAKKCKYCKEMLYPAGLEPDRAAIGPSTRHKRPQLIEQTAKKWKAIQLLGGVGIVLSIFLIAGSILIKFKIEASDPAFTLFTILLYAGLVCFVIGFTTYVVGRIAAWWYHG
jgi:hypothetical protein